MEHAELVQRFFEKFKIVIRAHRLLRQIPFISINIDLAPVRVVVEHRSPLFVDLVIGQAPLYFGPVEDEGLRCPYHGWKYAPDGKCIEMPNVPPAI